MTSPTGSDTATDALLQTCLAHLATPTGRSSDPLYAPVRTLAIDLLGRLHRNDLDLEALNALVRYISDDALKARAARFGAAHPVADWKTIVDAALAPLEQASLDEKRQALEAPRLGAVFTGHPTFALSRAMRDALGALASGRADVDLSALQHAPDPHISLNDEHADATGAIAAATQAVRDLTNALFDWLRQHAPDDWASFLPAPLRLATWVGYDLDGRTDIHWSHTIRIRLEEKARQLSHYAEALRALGGAPLTAMAERFSRYSTETAAQAALFDGDPEDPARVVAAANRLTGAGPHRIVSVTDDIAELGRLIAAEPDDARKQRLAVVRTDMAANRLGVAGIHLRVNASQVRSAVQADLGLAADKDFFDRRALDAAADRLAEAHRQAINFGSIYQEQMTARRQIMLCAQILKHIDADAPIRFLIAEIESPATILGAIYLARLYGIDDRIDISPLFETPDVLERGGRFMERLLDEPEYLAYIRKRGRLSVQYGFSDSGRFMGQIAGNMAIERLHVLLSRAMAARDVRDVEALVFNTHGESAGRGGFPGALPERLDYVLTPWSRARFAHDRVRLHAEVSFQGGDGYLHFQTPPLAQATLQALITWAFAPPAKPQDRFYDDINFSWDVYRSVKDWQQALFNNQHYQAVLGAFPPNLLPSTGSRKTRRQSGTSKDDAARALRAIPHNAILQQLAAPANVAAGFGLIAEREADRLVHMIGASQRMTQLVRMALWARRLSSISVLRTYANLFSPSFWTIRAARAAGDEHADIALRVAERLNRRALDVDMERLANLLSSDRRRFDVASAGLSGAAQGDAPFPAPLYVLHAIRMALVMRGLELVASTPPFSPRHDISRDTLIDQALDLRFDDIADALSTIFPLVLEKPAALDALEEPATSKQGPGGYPEVARAITAPLRRLDEAIKQISVGISHFYNAFG